MTRICHGLSCITPPHLLQKLLESQDQGIGQAARNTLLTTAQLRDERLVRSSLTSVVIPRSGRRTILDSQNSTVLTSAVIARTEKQGKSTDDSVNRAFKGFKTIRKFYNKVFNRNSIDGQGMRLKGVVHFGTNYNNAFWDGQEMVFGDGDGILFTDFTKSLDVIAHELTHGVTEHTAGLEYHVQSGALNESMSDVFGSLVKQWSINQSAADADWLIGAQAFTPGVMADALRSMKAPGTAYNNDQFGRDPQPDHMSKFIRLPDTAEGDFGGVHINSGIPNKAFYLTATNIGGYAWQAPGHIWYESLKASGAQTQFQDFADTTYAKAGQLYGAGSIQQKAVLAAWQEVGIRISGVSAGVGWRVPVADLTEQVTALSNHVSALVKDVRTLTDGQIPGGGGTLTDGQIPGGGGTLTDGQIPGGGGTLTDGQIPGGGGTLTDGQIPGGGDSVRISWVSAGVGWRVPVADLTEQVTALSNHVSALVKDVRTLTGGRIPGGGDS